VAVRKGTKTKKSTKTSSSSARKAKGKKSSTAPKAGKSAKAPIPWAVLFWLAFAIVIFGLFLYNREAIDNGIQIIANAFSSREASKTPDEKTLEVNKKEPQTTTPVIAPSAATQPSTAQPAEPAKTPDPAPNSGQTAPSQTGQNQPPAQRPPETRERVLYFVQVDRSGYTSRVQANRRLPVSDSPLTDVLHALIAGPNADEKGRGLISLIPPATKLLSASIRDSTAYLSFNEDFQYNTYGVEGYAGQLRQIVFTVTEFPNVSDVQIFIEGRRIDYLGEGVWVGSPVSRDML
jgi:spore germination protein GerM